MCKDCDELRKRIVTAEYAKKEADRADALADFIAHLKAIHDPEFYDKYPAVEWKDGTKWKVKP